MKAAKKDVLRCALRDVACRGYGLPDEVLMSFFCNTCLSCSQYTYLESCHCIVLTNAPQLQEITAVISAQLDGKIDIKDAEIVEVEVEAFTVGATP